MEVEKFPLNGIQNRTQKILAAIGEGLYERQEVIALGFLSAIAGESLFMLGPPGVGKSMVARRMKHAFQGGTSFEYLMNRFSTPDEIFGPISITRLSKEDKFERLTENYLPGASVVFLDEIWKAGPSIQNALLTVINEKLYRNGEQEVKVKLQGLVSASNELPANDEGLEALWDRFLVRYYVDRIMDDDNFFEMITSNTETEMQLAPELTIREEEIEQWSDSIDTIHVPAEVLDVIAIIRKYIEKYNQETAAGTNEQPELYVSDRRWRKIVRLMRTSAFLNERKEVDLTDCFLISFCIWNSPDQLDMVKSWVGQAISKHGITRKYNLSSVQRQIEQLKEQTQDKSREEKLINVEVPLLVDSRFFKLEGFPSDYNLMLRADFELLGGGMTDTKLYASYGGFKNYDVARLSTHEIEVRLGKDYKKFKLKSKIEQQKRFLPKRPDEESYSTLNRQIKDMLQYLDQVAEKLDLQRREFPQQVPNIFVDNSWRQVLESSMNDTLRQVVEYKMEVQKLRQDLVEVYG
jgi:MoxR-like ATPase